ncbi:MAG: hypothetical protein MEQ84_02645 [Mesorhizobium sp.]|nr:hypothetical protein [Mesorhizobium sp.]
MLIFKSGATSQDEAFERELMGLTSLLSDMARVGRGIRVEELAREAPVLDRWAHGQRPASCLVGVSTGHPGLPGNGRAIVTSDLVLMSEDGSWARTRSRWYRLGRPAGRGRHDA